MVSESTSSSRLGLWDSLKEHYQAATRILPWGSTLRDDCSTSDSLRDLTPPMALTIPNSSPIVILDATPMITSSSSTDDTLLSLPGIDSLPSDNSSKHEFSVMGPSMDKLKVREIIPLKTFTYCETAVKVGSGAKHASQWAGSASPSSVKRSLKKAPSQQPAPSCRSKTSPRSSTSAATSREARDELPPLPRHLAIRETRSNPDYLRMMACEMTMIRSLKLVSPLKPRGYLPRRKELFNTVKSPLSVSVEIPCEEEDNHQHPLFVGSWTSVSSAESFLSATSSTSSDYASADEDF
ncbi:hypothetical protein BGX34_010140 [Mortierella sp. NVP85]|nr:hypothetical protein BGX34_010140 [Mortierella sp. NVP85]